MPKATRSHSRKPSAAALVEQLAEMTLLPPDLHKALEDPRASDAWIDLRRQIDAEDGKPASRELEAHFERIHAALPDGVRRDLVEYSDGRDYEEYTSIEAAYRVGVAVGRRLGGAR